MATLKRYEVVVEHTSISEHRHIVLAYSARGAERLALDAAWGEESSASGPRIVWCDDEGDSVDDSDMVAFTTLVEPNGDHEVHPISLGGGRTESQCKLCGESVTWTGTSDPVTNACITPGPWVHTASLAKEN